MHAWSRSRKRGLRAGVIRLQLALFPKSRYLTYVQVYDWVLGFICKFSLV
jgi:hypothetical protein